MKGERSHNKPRDSRLIAIRWQDSTTSRPVLAGLISCAFGLLSGCVSPPHAGLESESRPVGQLSQPSLSSVGQCSLPHIDTVSPVAGDWRGEHPDGLWKRIRDGLVLWDIDHPRIQDEIVRLQRSKAALEAMLLRAQPYLHYIVSEVEQRGMPLEIALLPAVESGFQPHAFSHYGASGLWQFMPATAERFGLERNWWYDGRRDVVNATRAALTYLQHLHRRFDGDWLHGLAAYNAGGGTVSKAIRKNRNAGRPTDFWQLDLPGETDDYVPRLLALTAVINDPERYDIILPEMADKPAFLVLDAGDQLDLQVAAGLADISLEDLLTLNPAFNRGATPPDGPHHLLLPHDSVQPFLDGLAELPEQQRLRRTRYKVRAGDSLSTIAATHGLPVSAIKTANNLKGSFLRAGSDLIIPLSASEAVPPNRYARQPITAMRYKVQKGDSLYSIAQRYSVSVGDLRRWNRLEDILLKPGQRLTLHVDPSRKNL